VNRARIVNRQDASNGQKIGYMDYADSYVEFATRVEPGDYTMVVTYSNGMGQNTCHQVSVNGKPAGEGGRLRRQLRGIPDSD
jgi:hypothetical protein